jgi:hypothetical protein
MSNNEIIEWLKKKAEAVPMPGARKMYQAAVKALQAQNDMNKTDEAIHELFRADEEKDVKWNFFPNIGLCEAYYLWYYAENRLYIIKDCMTNGLYLIEARNPTEAFKKLVARLDEAMKAGEMADEEYDELF